jgi:hypothetical protein
MTLRRCRSLQSSWLAFADHDAWCCLRRTYVSRFGAWYKTLRTYGLHSCRGTSQKAGTVHAIALDALRQPVGPGIICAHLRASAVEIPCSASCVSGLAIRRHPAPARQREHLPHAIQQGFTQRRRENPRGPQSKDLLRFGACPRFARSAISTLLCGPLGFSHFPLCEILAHLPASLSLRRRPKAVPATSASHRRCSSDHPPSSHNNS